MKNQLASKQEIIKIITFCISSVALLCYSSLVLNFTKGNNAYNRCLYNEYKSLEKNSLDVLFVGSSATDRYWIPALAWNKKGITSFSYCSNGCPTSMLVGLIEECMKTQCPEVVVIELRASRKSVATFEEKRLHSITYNLVKGRTKKKVVDTIFELSEKYLGEESTIDTKDKSYLSGFVNTHNFWKKGITLNKLLMLFPYSDERGYDTDTGTIWKTAEIANPIFTDKTYELGEYETESLNILLKYCEKMNCEVLFLCTPFSTSLTSYGKLNTAKEIVIERGYKVLDFNSETMIKKYGYDFQEDFYNSNHANIKGAVKTTRAILEYLDENYELSDHRKDTDYAERWDDVYDKFVEKIKKKRPDLLSLVE